MLTNEEVLQRVTTERQLLTRIKCCKTAYLDHVLRAKNTAFCNLFSKEIAGRRGGRQVLLAKKHLTMGTGIHEAGEGGPGILGGPGN